MRINPVLLVFELSLLAWFFGCIVTYKIGRRTLVEGMGIHSAEFLMLLIFAGSILSSLLFPVIGRWIVVAALLFWLTVQFFCHWYYTLFGASDKKIKGYNECFKNTIHLIPQRDDKIIPDLYHIVLHLLILVNLILSVTLR